MARSFSTQLDKYWCLALCFDGVTLGICFSHGGVCHGQASAPLPVAGDERSGGETATTIYGELRGHEVCIIVLPDPFSAIAMHPVYLHATHTPTAEMGAALGIASHCLFSCADQNRFSEDKGEVGWSPLLWGLSYENYVTVVLGLSAIGGNSSTPLSSAVAATPETLQALGLDEAKLDRTWDAYRRLASFQWVTTANPENSAFVSMTHVNSSGLTDPPLPYGPPSPPPATLCDDAGPHGCQWKVGKEALTIGTGPDISHLPAVSNASQCCTACKNFVRPNKGRAPGCGVWFYNGISKVCYLKSHGSPDTITKPSPLFAAGYGSYSESVWCEFTGSFQDPPMVGCPAPVRSLRPQTGI